jgi:hypothetical protein
MIVVSFFFFFFSSLQINYIFRLSMGGRPSWSHLATSCYWTRNKNNIFTAHLEEIKKKGKKVLLLLYFSLSFNELSLPAECVRGTTWIIVDIEHKATLYSFSLLCVWRCCYTRIIVVVVVVGRRRARYSFPFRTDLYRKSQPPRKKVSPLFLLD